MADLPTLHVTNWSSRKLHGPGRKLTIMARPRSWEHGDGKVVDLTPSVEDLDDVRSGAMGLAEYRTRCEGWFARFPLGPGDLRTLGGVIVADGDTLLCACSREAAGRGECHRVWAAAALVAAGWRVVLDGVEVARG